MLTDVRRTAPPAADWDAYATNSEAAQTPAVAVREMALNSSPYIPNVHCLRIDEHTKSILFEQPLTYVLITLYISRVFCNSLGDRRDASVLAEVLFHAVLGLGDGGGVRSTETCADLAQFECRVAPAQDNRQHPRRMSMVDPQLLLQTLR